MSTVRRSAVALLGASALVLAVGAAVRVTGTATAAVSPAEVSSGEPTDPAEAEPAAPPATARAAELPTCEGATRTVAATPQDDRLRAAAQAGLSFLERSTVGWQQQHQCYGCHVQAVTLKAMAVGRHHDYAVDEASLATVVRGLTELPGGSRNGGLRYSSGIYLSASKSLGGAAFALYDAWLGTELGDDLLRTAEELRALQTDSGDIRNDYTHAPVAIGPLQDTVLAMATWNQAYARTADDAWLTAVGRAEDWLAGQVASWGGAPPDLQSVDYALMGLHAARSGTSEEVTRQLVRWVLDAQQDDGGWSLDGTASDAYATGQALYTLRTLGFTETDPAVARGTAWLVDHQGEEGGWSRRGRERAEAMWAVLGLVSVDVLTLTAEGLEEGAHVEGIVPVEAVARDNEGGGVVEVELRVDDVPVHRACGDRLAWSWDTRSLASGAHVVDLVARNAAGRTASRRFTVYAGDHWLTRLGSHYEDGGTVLSFRNLAPTEVPDTVRLTVHRVENVDGVERAGAVLSTEERPGTQGAMRFFWTGPDGEAAGDDRFFARLAWVDGDGAVRQTEELLFVHDTPEAQRSRYAEIGGQLRLGGAEGAATRIELVDELGNVVSSTTTTEAGQYRFKNVRRGAYKVRVQKDGWGEQELDVQAAPAAAAEAVDFELE